MHSEQESLSHAHKVSMKKSLLEKEGWKIDVCMLYINQVIVPLRAAARRKNYRVCVYGVLCGSQTTTINRRSRAPRQYVLLFFIDSHQDNGFLLEKISENNYRAWRAHVNELILATREIIACLFFVKRILLCCIKPGHNFPVWGHRR